MWPRFARRVSRAASPRPVGRSSPAGAAAGTRAAGRPVPRSHGEAATADVAERRARLEVLCKGFVCHGRRRSRRSLTTSRAWGACRPGLLHEQIHPRQHDDPTVPEGEHEEDHGHVADGAEVADQAAQRDGDQADQGDRGQNAQGEHERQPEGAPGGGVVLRGDEADDERHAGQVAGTEDDAHDAPGEGREQGPAERLLEAVAQAGEDLLEHSATAS